MLMLFPALLIACNPPAGAPSAGQTVNRLKTPEANSLSDQTADAAPTGLNTNGAPAEVDAAGIPVGFTAEGRPYRGSLDAPIVMEEFSDFQCPYCARFAAETLPSILTNQITAGEVVLIYYDFPLNSIHPQAAAAANAARCAGENGPVAYWAMHDRLFENASEWSSNEANAVFLTYAQELGFGGEAFATCLEENRHAEAVEVDSALGQSRGVGSTPTFFLNDQPVIGAYPLDYFNQAIAAVGAGDAIAAQAETEPQAPTVKPTPATIVLTDSAAERGDPEAAVTIVEYTDYQCPYCLRHASETMPLLLAEMIETGRVHYVVKDFPLDSIHPEARAAAVAARCAGDQDAYWEMHDELFARQAEWAGLGAGANDVFATLATDLGLDAAAFTECVASGRHAAVVQANQNEGITLGVTGTPAFFINGFPISGAQPYELFEYAIGLAEEGTLAEAYVAPEAEAQPTPAGPAEVNTDGAFSVGAADAPVTIVEFTDFQCPFCSRHFLETYPQIKADYVDTGKVRYVFMDFPLSSIHPQAQLAAEAARCAGDQDAYLEMHDILFGRQGEWSGRDDAADIFIGYAQELGLDTATFTECLNSGVHESAVLADLQEGARVGVDGTPAFFINGAFVSGAQPFEVFQQTIDSFLAAES
jgi:protein-disulfide isomerase